MAAKKKAAAGGSKTNKSAFVRGLPFEMPAKDVVEKGKANGIKLSVAYVYSIRAASKAATRKSTGEAPPRRGRPPKTASGAGTAANGGGRVEELLRAVAAEIGLSRAIGILQSEQQKVRAVFAR